LLKAVVVPVRHGQAASGFPVESQAGPDQAIALFNRKAGEVELRRYRLDRGWTGYGCSGHLPEAQAVVRATIPSSSWKPSVSGTPRWGQTSRATTTCP
jgi:hypothetical protein